MLNFMKIRSVAVELFHDDGRKDRHDEANSRFTKFCAIKTRVKFCVIKTRVKFCAIKTRVKSEFLT